MEAVRVENLKKSYGEKEVLKGVSFSLNRGQVLAILGPNASGKTTLIKSILGLVIPESGSITVLGRDIREGTEYRKRIGYMPQEPKFPENLTPRELMELVADIREEKAYPDEFLELFRLKEFWDTPVKKLSGGTKQKVNALVAFSFKVDLLILDEPTVGLDPLSSALLKREILKRKEEGTAVLLTSHIVSEVEQMADRVLFLIEGEVRADHSVDYIKRETGTSTLEEALLKLLGERV
ncbi:MAG: ABC transporter ATP-binding protein [Aquificae bacterium]|nr:ABC transporter ATP-binding protein [Aquificota bacterium]